jgi:hypothetical protein
MLSDIPVNREIEEPGVSFFRSGNASDLAASMRDALDRPPPPRPDRATLIESGRRRRAACGQVLLQAIEAARRR